MHSISKKLEVSFYALTFYAYNPTQHCFLLVVLCLSGFVSVVWDKAHHVDLEPWSISGTFQQCINASSRDRDESCLLRVHGKEEVCLIVQKHRNTPSASTLFLHQILTLRKTEFKIETCANNFDSFMYLWHDPSFAELNETLLCAAEICCRPTGKERVRVI